MNPLKQIAPWARIVTLIIIGMAVIYGIGRWDQRISADDALLAQQTRAILSTASSARSWRDSVRSIEAIVRERDAELAATAARHRRDLARLARADQVEIATLARTPLDSLLPPLRMRPIQLPPVGGARPVVVYATDSTGVRFLSGRMLRLGQLRRAAVTRDSLVGTQAARLLVLEAGFTAATLRGDSSEARLLEVEPLLERFLKRVTCRILWLIPCPSRTTSFVVGVIAGGAVAVALIRE